MATSRCFVKPQLVAWARKRAGYSFESLAGKLEHLPQWESGERQPTLAQLKNFARTVHVPLGYLFASEPPNEVIPIADFRGNSGQPIRRPSPNLLDTIYTCQNRQDWYREFALVNEQSELPFVESVSLETAPARVAADLRSTLSFDLDERLEYPNWTEALHHLIRKAENVGILVMISGIVLSNNRRTLDPGEFTGFSLCDDIAPLIFVNARDAKSALIFAVAYELAHIWLGASGVSKLNIGFNPSSNHPVERWCSAVAAELLVPLAVLEKQLRPNEVPGKCIARLSRVLEVSPLLILRRLHDAGRIDTAEFERFWSQKIRSRVPVHQERQGGNFYRTTLMRVSPRFARALIGSTLNGNTMYRDAVQLLGIWNTKTFKRLGRSAGLS